MSNQGATMHWSKLAKVAEQAGGESFASRPGDTGGTVYPFTGNPVPPQGVTAHLIDVMCAVRKDRAEQFPGVLGSDSCWDVLLHLYAVHLDQYRVNISRLRKRTRIAETTLLRTLTTLTKAGLVTRSASRFDRRSVMIELSPAGIAAITRYFTRTGTRAVLI
jgi:DNA-binding HxlR family transcriptional regulator